MSGNGSTVAEQRALTILTPAAPGSESEAGSSVLPSVVERELAVYRSLAFGLKVRPPAPTVKVLALPMEIAPWLVNGPASEALACLEVKAALGGMVRKPARALVLGFSICDAFPLSVILASLVVMFQESGGFR